MNIQSYYYNSSPEYVATIDPFLQSQLASIIRQLPKRLTQSEINSDLFWLLSSHCWSFDTVQNGTTEDPPECLNLSCNLTQCRNLNNRDICRTSTTLQNRWHADFAKSFGSKLVHIEAQFGKVEAMFKDFCGFRIAYAERRLSLGIEIVLSHPARYFSHRRNAIGGMASFEVAKETLTTIGLECPIWLIGIDE
jgi:hypothetical protein